MRLPFDIERHRKLPFNHRDDIAQTAALTAADVENALVAAVDDRSLQGVDHVIHINKVTHDRAVAPNLDLLPTQCARNQRADDSLAFGRVVKRTIGIGYS